MTNAEIMQAGREFIKELTGGGSPPAADPGAEGWTDGARQAVAATFDAYANGTLDVNQAIQHIGKYIRGHSRLATGDSGGYDDMSPSGGGRQSTALYSKPFDDMGTTDTEESELSIAAAGILSESGRRASAAARRWTTPGVSEAQVRAAKKRWTKD
jgi:hypothetical protein